MSNITSSPARGKKILEQISDDGSSGAGLADHKLVPTEPVHPWTRILLWTFAIVTSTILAEFRYPSIIL